MQHGKHHPSVPTTGNASFPIFDEQPGITSNNLSRRAGSGLRVRFVLALTLIAMLPAVGLVLMLGDPTGREQQATLGAMLFTQARVQAQAINQVIAERQTHVTNLALTAQANQESSLKEAQASDPASIAWLIIDINGFIFASGDHQQLLVNKTLKTAKLVSDPSALLYLSQSAATATGKASQTPVVGNDTITRQVWIAFAAPIPTVQGKVLVAIFTVPKLLNNLLAPPGSLNGSASILLDQKEQISAEAGTLVAGRQRLALAPTSIAGIPSNTTTPTTIVKDPLTGHTDLAIGISVPALSGQYIVLVDQNTILIPGNRYLFAGHNTPLLLLGIFIVVILVAILITLPITRSVQRATSVIVSATEDVRKFALDAQTIAEDQTVSTTILTVTSKRLSSHRLVLMRDITQIARVCQDVLPRLQLLHHKQQEARDKQTVDELEILYQYLQQIHGLASTLADGLNKDTSLDQLEQAMTGTRALARQFETVSKQLEAETKHLAAATRYLI